MEGTRPRRLKQWDNKENGTIINVTPPLVRGKPDAARADITFEAVLTKATEQHMALELTNSLMYWDQDRLIVYYTNQHAHGSRAGLSQALKIPSNRVRVIQPGYMGSGYGYRSGIDLAEVHSAILAKITGRPVKTMYTREEDFVTRTHRPEFRNEMKLGVNRDGTLQSGQFRVFANVGAQRAGAANGSWFSMQNLYKIPEPEARGDRRLHQQLQVRALPLRQPSQRHLRARDDDGEGGVRHRHGPGRVPPEEHQRGGEPGHQEAVQQPRHPRVHQRGRGTHRLEDRSGTRRGPRRCGPASFTASASPRTPAATAPAPTRPPAR